MNMNERYERVFGVAGGSGKKECFFSGMGALGRFLCSFWFIGFINFSMRSVVSGFSGWIYLFYELDEGL